MKAAWVSTWTRPIPGREANALGVFMESQDFWGKRQADGQITGVDTYLSPAGHGMVVISGERDEISAIFETDEYLRLMGKISLNVEGGHGEFMYMGDASDKLIGIWADVGKEQGYL